MLVQSVAGAAALAALLSFGTAQAAMSPVVPGTNALVQHVDCAAGFRLGPVGGCVLGTDDEHHDHDRVIERRATDDGCQTKSVQRSDGMGNTETRTKTNCD